MNKITIRDQLLTSLSLSGAGCYPRLKLLDIACSHPGCDDRESVEETLDDLIQQGLVAKKEGLIYAVPSELDLAEYFAAADRYRKQMAKSKRLRTRICASFMRNLCAFWQKCWGGIVLIVATASLTVGLCAIEVPDSIIRALVMVESGAKWRGIGDISGGWKRGKAGEVSHFQLTSGALSDMRAPSAYRIAQDPVLAESFARLWLSRCYDKCGNWRDALASYNGGRNYRSKRCRDYADRVLSLTTTN